MFFTPVDFRKIFSPEDLFGFSAEGIGVLTKPVETRESVGTEETDDEPGAREPTIWLDTGG